MENHALPESPLRVKTLELAVRIVKLSNYLRNEKKEFVISNQIFKSGTNPGAMVREAQYAESPADFIHKLGVARKEINETLYWLEVLHRTLYITFEEFESLTNDGVEIAKMLTSSIQTKRKNSK